MAGEKDEMRIFLAGASGVIGRTLVSLLVGAGHEVGGMTPDGTKEDLLRVLGAQRGSSAR